MFSVTNFSYSTITERMQECAFLLKELTIDVVDEIENRSESFHYDNGISSFVEYLNDDKKALLDKKMSQQIEQIKE